jgi:aspartate kinase
LPVAIKPILDSGEVPVLTGFFGADEQGRTTVFGRGGSDYTAAVVASALDAESLELWKDVYGFNSADPKIVEDAHVVPFLSYEEAAEMAYFGAKVLHPLSIWPVSEKGIPVWVGNIDDTQKMRGTWITRKEDVQETVVKCVAHSRSVAILKIHGSGIGLEYGVLSKLVTALSDAHINIKSVITSQTSIALLLDKADLKKAHQILAALREKTVESIEPLSDIGLVACVGKGMITTQGIAGKVFGAVAKEGINVEMISSGASETAYYFIVKKENLDRAVRAIHGAVFTN